MGFMMWVFSGGSGSIMDTRTKASHSDKPSEEAGSICAGLGSKKAL